MISPKKPFNMLCTTNRRNTRNNQLDSYTVLNVLIILTVNIICCMTFKYDESKSFAYKHRHVDLYVYTG